eukprot:Hpha_TRINITY_DN16072_c0_g1::TRINITY_DN16072_c0_g1_i6::g.119281::m.119281
MQRLFTLCLLSAAWGGNALQCSGCFQREELNLMLLLPVQDSHVSHSIQAGAVAAAADLRIPLTVRSIFNDLKASHAALEEPGFDGAVVWAARRDPELSALMRETGYPIVAIGTGDTELVGAGAALDIGTNDTAVGEAAGRELLSRVEGNFTVLCVRDSERAALLDRCQGARSVVPSLVEMAVDGSASVLAASEEVLSVYEGVSGQVVVLAASVGAFQVVQRFEQSISPGCIETDEQVVNALRSDSVLFAIDTVPYNQGYYAMHLLSILLHTANKPANTFVDTGWVTLTPANVGAYPRLACLSAARRIVLCPEEHPDPQCSCVNRTEAARLAMVYHESPLLSPFWKVPAAGITHWHDSVSLQPDPPWLHQTHGDLFDPEYEAHLVRDTLSLRPDALGVTVPHPLVEEAVAEYPSSTPVYLFNAGANRREALGARSYLGQLETRAGEGAGEYFTVLGAKKVLCLNGLLGATQTLERCRGLQKGFSGNATMVPVPGESNRDGIKSVVRRQLQNDPEIDGFLCLNVGVLKAAAEVAAEEFATRKIFIGGFDFDKAVAELLAAGSTAFAIHQGPYLQGYLTALFAAQGVLSQSPIREDVIHTGPQIVTAQNFAPFLCEGDGYPLCPPPIPSVKDNSASEVTWVVVGSVGGVLLLVVLIGLWHSTRSWRRMRKLRSAVAMAEMTAESVARMEFEGLGHLRDIKRPTRLQAAFQTIIDNLIEYRRYLPASLLHCASDADSDTDFIDVGNLPRDHTNVEFQSLSLRSSTMCVSIRSPGVRMLERNNSMTTPNSELSEPRREPAEENRFNLSLKVRRVSYAVVTPGTFELDGNLANPAALYNCAIACVEGAMQGSKGLLQIS